MTLPGLEEPAARPLRVWVPGVPQRQGDMSAVNGRVFHSHGPALNQWRKDVGTLAGQRGRRADRAHVWQVALLFALPRPEPAKGGGRGDPYRRELASVWPRQPDVDKLARAVLDALTGVVWRDDEQVVALVAQKAYADLLPSGRPGLDLRCEPVAPRSDAGLAWHLA